MSTILDHSSHSPSRARPGKMISEQNARFQLNPIVKYFSRSEISKDGLEELLKNLGKESPEDLRDYLEDRDDKDNGLFHIAASHPKVTPEIFRILTINRVPYTKNVYGDDPIHTLFTNAGIKNQDNFVYLDLTYNSDPRMTFEDTLNSTGHTYMNYLARSPHVTEQLLRTVLASKSYFGIKRKKATEHRTKNRNGETVYPFLELVKNKKADSAAVKLMAQFADYTDEVIDHLNNVRDDIILPD